LLPKWKSRCWVGVYVGRSLAHSGNVPVVYNPQTMHISPQFHMVFDDQFTTVTANPKTCSQTFYDSLYKTASWLHKDIYGATADLHHFETYWSAPPLTTAKIRSMDHHNIARSSKANLSPLQQPVKDPNGDPAGHQNGDPARHPDGNPATQPAGNLVRQSDSDSAAHTVIGLPATYSEGAPTAHLARLRPDSSCTTTYAHNHHK